MKTRPKRAPADRILTCALKEFSRHGYSGARMDRIARGAAISKRMLFYYFGSKQRLFEVVLESAWRNGEVISAAPPSAAETMPFWTAFYMNNPEWTRIVGWEGLEWKKGPVLREKERRVFWKYATEMTKKGGWPPELDTAHLLFALIAMEMAPVLFPNLARLILDRDTRLPAFQREWTSFMRSFNQVLMRTDPAPADISARPSKTRK
jgi:AcrR family transcriptional regulator